MEKGYTQQQVANMLFIERTTVVRWENGTRMPDIHMLSRIAELLGVETGDLIQPDEKANEKPIVILVDDEKIVLAGGLPILEKSLPDAVISGFDKPSAALEFARSNPVSLAFLDIEMGKNNGLEICQELLKINPRTNVVFLTSYIDYSFDAWSTGACGFLLKPLTVEKVSDQLNILRHPIGLVELNF
jgi:transcriptional regulator with XRE-family HTH domain